VSEPWRKGQAPWEKEKQVRERDIESYLRDEVKKIGGKAYKTISPGNDGFPDRLIALPGNKILFVELKAPGKKATPQQLKRQQEMANLGCIVFNEIDTREKVDGVIDYCVGLMKPVRR
jgi:hypothetical protein